MFQRAKYQDFIADHKSRDWQNIPNQVASLKMDGGAYWLVFDKEGTPSYISRRPSVKGGYPDKTANMPHLADFKIPELAGFVINGEIIHTGLYPDEKESHSRVSGILNSLPPRAIETQRLIGPNRYVIHDIINPALSTYGDKITEMHRIEKLINKPGLIFTPKFYTKSRDIENLLDYTKKTGREGIIITSLTTPEEINKRIKIKHFDTYNLRVSKIIQEIDKDGNPKESMGALEVVDATNKPVGKVGTGFSRNDRVDAYTNPNNWIGKLIQVKTMGFAVNALRSPVYNGDADGEWDRVF